MLCTALESKHSKIEEYLFLYHLHFQFHLHIHIQFHFHIFCRSFAGLFAEVFAGRFAAAKFRLKQKNKPPAI